MCYEFAFWEHALAMPLCIYSKLSLCMLALVASLGVSFGDPVLDDYSSLKATRGKPAQPPDHAADVSLVNTVGTQFCAHVNFGNPKEGSSPPVFFKVHCIVHFDDKSGMLTVTQTRGFGPAGEPEKFSTEERSFRSNMKLSDAEAISFSESSIDNGVSIRCKDPNHNHCITAEVLPSGQKSTTGFLEFPLALRASKATEFLSALARLGSPTGSDTLYCGIRVRRLWPCD
jgi:hypothetical protein